MRRLAVIPCLLLVAGHAAYGQRHAGSLSSSLLPAPDGAWRVGTIVMSFVDSTRQDPETADRFGGRPITAQLWYPVDSGAVGDPAPYVPERGLVDSLIGEKYYEDTLMLRSWLRMRTHAQAGGRVARGQHPFVTISHGFGMARANQTAFAEELASHGYIVAALDHAHGGFMVLPDGSLASSADDSTRWDDPAFHASQMNVWAADIASLIDRLHGVRVPEAVRGVAQAIDWSRVGALGHSSGGLAAIEACEHDPRVRTCVNLDGGLLDPHGDPIADFVRAGITRPTLILQSRPIYSDADHARLHRTRAQWEASGRAHRAALDSLLRTATAPVFIASVSGTGHMSFSDGPFVMPTTITRFGGRPIDADRGFRVISQLLLAFLDEQFGARPPGTFARVARSAPEVEMRHGEHHRAGKD